MTMLRRRCAHVVQICLGDHHRLLTLGSPPTRLLAVKDGLSRFARLPAAAAPRLQMRSVPRHPAHLHLHLLRSPPHPVASTAQVVRPAPIRSSSPRCSPRQSLQCRRQVSCPFPGEKYGTPRHPNLLSTPQVRASDLIDLTLNELSGFAAQAPDYLAWTSAVEAWSSSIVRRPSNDAQACDSSC